MANGWFKLYSDLPDNPRLRALPPSTQLAFVWLMCLANRGFFESGKNDFAALAWTLRCTGREGSELQKDVGRLMEAGFVDDHGKPINWETRQGQALSDAERKRRQRERERDSHEKDAELSRDGHVTVTDESQGSGARVKTDKTRQENTPTPLRDISEEDSAFERFWSAYPKRFGKAKARRAFHAAADRMPPIDDLLAALARQKASAAWADEGGRFVPAPATWIEDERWTDELPGESPEKKEAAADPTRRMEAFALGQTDIDEAE